MFTIQQIEEAAEKTIAKAFDEANNAAYRHGKEPDFVFALEMGLTAGITMQLFLCILKEMEEEK